MDVRLTDFKVGMKITFNDMVTAASGHDDNVSQQREGMVGSLLVVHNDQTHLSSKSLPLDKDPNVVEKRAERDERTTLPREQKSHVRRRGHDTDMEVNADFLEILVPSTSPHVCRKSGRYESPERRRRDTAETTASDTASAVDGGCNDTGTPGGIRHEKGEQSTAVEGTHPAPTNKAHGSAGRGRRRQTWPQRQAAALAAAAAAAVAAVTAVAGKRGGNGTAESVATTDAAEPPAIAHQEGEQEEQGKQSEDNGAAFRKEGRDDGNAGAIDDDDSGMTRIVEIDSFKYRRSLKWSFQSSRDWQGSDDVAGDDNAGNSADIRGAREGQGRDSTVRGKCGAVAHVWPSSQMSIELRAGVVGVSLPPRYRLGNLQVAALLQWKGIQAALGELAKIVGRREFGLAVVFYLVYDSAGHFLYFGGGLPFLLVDFL